MTALRAREARPKAIHFDHHDTSGDLEITVEEDIDTPRVVQWIDDEDLDDHHSENEPEPSQRLQSLQDDLSALPLGTLRSAQRSLAQAQALSNTESDTEENYDTDSTFEDDDSFSHPVKGKEKEKPVQSSKPKNAISKRTNKHAPMEVTSKRPVSRRRAVVDDTLPKPRDPRFMHAAGRYDSAKFKHQYDFLQGVRKDELSTLHEHMKRAQKLLANSPLHLRAEREVEVKRLERAVKRAESAVNLDNREHIESIALLSAKHAEKEKRQQGKTEWWMKRSEKKTLLAKARLDAIASAGGKRAVKKAVEKKQKKQSQKEKKMRPFPRSEGKERSDGKRRRQVGSVDVDRGMKRRRVM